MKPAFFLNLIPDFSFFLPLSFSLSLFFQQKFMEIYIYIYLFTLDSRFISTSPLRHYLLSRGHGDYFLNRTEFPVARNEGGGGGKATISPLHGAQKSLSPEKWTRFAWFSAPILLRCEWRETIAADFASNYCGYSNPDRWRVLREPLDLRGFAEGASWAYQFVTPAIFSTRFSHIYISLYIYYTPCEKLD